MKAVITLLQKEWIRLNDMSTEAKKYGLHELYNDLVLVKVDILKAIQILQSHEQK